MKRYGRVLAFFLAVSLGLSACGGRGPEGIPRQEEDPPAPVTSALPQGAISQGGGNPSTPEEPPSSAPEQLPQPAGQKPEEPSQLPVPAAESALPEPQSPVPQPEEPEPAGPAPEEPPASQEPSPQEPASEEPKAEEPSPAPQPDSPKDGEDSAAPSQPETPEGCRWLSITEATVLALINRERGRLGLQPLTQDGDLAAAARVRAAELYRGNYVAHTRPGGEPWETVLKKEVPLDFARAAENLAWTNHAVGGEIGAFQWFEMWRQSESHYAAMVNEQYTCCGVAVLTGPYFQGEDQSYAVTLFCSF